MPIILNGDCAIFDGTCDAEEAESLRDWLQASANPSVDLSTCAHLHTALFQLLRRGQVPVASVPANPFLCRLIPFLTPADPGAAAPEGTAPLDASTPPTCPEGLLP